MTATARFLDVRGCTAPKNVHKARRPFTAVALLATAAHHGFELWAGVGLVFQPFLTLPGSVAMWATSLPALLHGAVRGGDRWSPVLANAAGAGLAGAVVHYTIWPWELRAGVPTLTEAEGLSPRQLPAYNVILWTWVVASTLALLRETPRDSRKWFALGLLNVVPLRLSAKHHFAWAHDQARANPAWWNRGLQGS
jgi:hypothetical protein